MMRAPLSAAFYNSPRAMATLMHSEPGSLENRTKKSEMSWDENLTCFLSRWTTNLRFWRLETIFGTVCRLSVLMIPTFSRGIIAIETAVTGGWAVLTGWGIICGRQHRHSNLIINLIGTHQSLSQQLHTHISLLSHCTTLTGRDWHESH